MRRSARLEVGLHGLHDVRRPEPAAVQRHRLLEDDDAELGVMGHGVGGLRVCTTIIE